MLYWTNMPPVTRRSFLGSLPLWPLAAAGPRPAEWRPAGLFPFSLGVASGEPASDGFVLWTRLAPDPTNGGGMPPADVPVTWEIAHDERLLSLIRRGVAMARPGRAHAVHVEVGGLEPDRWYWYRFRVGDTVSAVGRARTLPARGASVRGVRFAFASCQHFEQGYFTAYRHMADEDLAMVFHLGDYIYESGARQGRARQHLSPELLTLADYRNRYAQYKLDPDLQAAHAAFPWIVTWDDHEVADNYAGTLSEDGEPASAFLARRAAAYRAYYEHLPLRAGSRPQGSGARMYRRFDVGGLASYCVLDTRQFRTDQPCGDNTTWPCDAMNDPRATILGATQARWLHDGFTRSRALWNVLPQQVMMAKVNRRQQGRDRYTMDHWAGYDVERRRLLGLFAAHPERNPVVLTGDLHSSWVNDLCVEPDGPTVATELVGTSISSGGDGQDLPQPIEAVLADNPFVRFYNEQRGYVSCDVGPDAMHARYRVLDYVAQPGAPCRTRAAFIIEAGRPGAHRE
jgi:alkaline phosphatase D